MPQVDPWQVSLPQYEGPLDLLLALVRQQQVPLEELPLAAITGQYLAYVAQARTQELALSADFVYMAATLIQLKSRLLLPGDPDVVRREARPDPREELIEQLRNHELRHAAAQNLGERLQQAEGFLSRPAAPSPPLESETGSDPAGPRCASLADYLQVYRRALDRAAQRIVVQVQAETYPQEERAVWLAEWLAAHASSPTVELDELFRLQPTHPARVGLFLAVLEGARQQRLALAQAAAWTPVILARQGAESGAALEAL